MNYLPQDVDTAPMYIGLYDEVKWPNPLKSFVGSAALLEYTPDAIMRDDFGSPYPNTPGMVSWFPQKEGTFKDASTNPYKMDYYKVKEMHDEYETLVTAYEAKKAVYEAEALLYNTAVANEMTRQADAIRLLGEPPYLLPKRPCAPSPAPGPYSDNIIIADVTTTAFSAWTAANKASKWSTFSEQDSIPSVVGSFKEGYLQVSSDVSAVPTADSLKYVGHTYGLLG